MKTDHGRLAIGIRSFVKRGDSSDLGDPSHIGGRSLNQSRRGVFLGIGFVTWTRFSRVTLITVLCIVRRVVRPINEPSVGISGG